MGPYRTVSEKNINFRQKIAFFNALNCNALNISQIRLQMAPQDSKIAVEILQSVNNRTQSFRKILGMVITDIVINTLHGRVTRHPAGMHCPSWDDAFVSSLHLIFNAPA